MYNMFGGKLQNCSSNQFEKRVYRVLVGKTEEKKSFGRPRHMYMGG
jgi:hypothetical protein